MDEMKNDDYTRFMGDYFTTGLGFEICEMLERIKRLEAEKPDPEPSDNRKRKYAA